MHARVNVRSRQEPAYIAAGIWAVKKTGLAETRQAGNLHGHRDLRSRAFAQLRVRVGRASRRVRLNHFILATRHTIVRAVDHTTHELTNTGCRSS
jgi:hypothetical protein